MKNMSFYTFRVSGLAISVSVPCLLTLNFFVYNYKTPELCHLCLHGLETPLKKGTISSLHITIVLLLFYIILFSVSLELIIVLLEEIFLFVDITYFSFNSNNKLTCTLQFACMFYVCIIHFVTVNLTDSDTNCTTSWVQHESNRIGRGTLHSSISTLTECQKVCEFDPHCIAVDWSANSHRCWINTDPNHQHYDRFRDVRHYHLVRRCNITTG